MRASLIATTYNQPKDLDLYLRTVAAQADVRNDDWELVLADDGSGAETRAVIEAHRAVFVARGISVRHVWHEDEGYRKCKILNAAVREARGQWLIFTDSDLVLHPQFVSDHLSLEARGRVVMGRRVDLGPAASDWVRAHPKELWSARFRARVLASAWDQPPSRNVQRAIRAPRLARAVGGHRVPDLLGSNFSIDRELLERVNGFDESSIHYWGEDGDLFVRLRNVGAEILGRKYFAVQLHLWHKMRQPQPDAQAAYQRKLADRAYVRCEQGLIKR